MNEPAKCPRCGNETPAHAPEGLCPRCLVEMNLAPGATSAMGAVSATGTGSGRTAPLAVEEVARLFPEMEILGLLGTGGMGAVYKARQPKLDRLVALKILDRRGRDPRFVERFGREARTLARLNHPNIVAVHEFGEREGLFFLVLELVDGVSLRDLLREGKMPPEQALAIVPPICEALQYAHDKGVVHRDIKPENILVDKEGRVKVADFGIAKFAVATEEEPHLTGDAERIGTVHYMAPEQVERPAEVDHRADIYALGVVFYEMLTGELPLGKFPEPSKRVEVDVRLDEVVLKALEKEPARRYQQASEVKTRVETITGTPSARSSEREFASSETARPPAVVDAKRNAKEATMLFAGTVFFLFLFAVVLELSRASVVPFKGFLILMCILGLVICVLSLAGFWPFPSPWFPEPNFSSRNLRRNRPVGYSEPDQSPRFSRPAIVGAIWGLCALGTAVLFSPIGASAAVDLRNTLGRELVNGLIYLAALLGITAPFGTTILGTVAISQIRHSRGRLYGLGLAVFDALLFPLLVLNIFIVGSALIGLRAGVASPGFSPAAWSWANFWWLGLVVLGVIVIVDWLIIRAVWRATHKPVGGGSAPVVDPTPATPGRSGSGGKVVAVIVAVVLLVLAVPVGSMLLAIYRPYLTRQQAMSAQALVSVEQRLEQELKAKLQEVEFDAASISVSIDPSKRDRAECVISGLVKYEGLRSQEPGIQRLYSAAHGGGTFRHEGGGRWFFTGSGALQTLRFHTDASDRIRSLEADTPALTKPQEGQNIR